MGIVACLQTHSSRANWHPHRHLLVTDGGFRPDGTFVSWPAHDTARLIEAFRRAVLRLFVRLHLFDEDQAVGMLTWPHSVFHMHTAVWVPEDDRAFATRLARYCARNPVALERLTYDRAAKAVTYRSDKSEGPTAGTETADPLEFLARVLVHIPDKGHVTTRYYGCHANRPRGMRRRAEPAAAGAPPAIVPAPRLAPTEASLTHVYGLTETAPLITVCEPRPEHAALSPADRARIKARQGVELLTSGELRVADEEGIEVPHDGSRMSSSVAARTFRPSKWRVCCCGIRPCSKWPWLACRTRRGGRHRTRSLSASRA